MSNQSIAAVASSSTASSGSEKKKKLIQFKFPSHQSHMVTLAKMCQESKDYADCAIQCGDNPVTDRITAHRLVLGAASPFLKQVFQDVPQSLAEATLVVPGISRSTVESLINFLYTGEMVVDREDAADLQRLIETLQINPDLISVEGLEKKAEEPDPGAKADAPAAAESEEKKQEREQEQPVNLSKEKSDDLKDEKDDEDLKVRNESGNKRRLVQEKEEQSSTKKAKSDN